MSTLSVPLPSPLEHLIDEMVRKGVAPNKAAVVRKAIVRFAEEEAVEDVLRAMREVKNGKILRGDLRELVKRLP